MPADPCDARSPRLALHHERTRRRGVNPLVYWAFRALAQPALHAFFRLRRTGHRHIPKGPVILAANHRSFLDPFVIGCCLRRPVFFVAKRELFQSRLVGWFLNCLGAFPVRRGESDAESLETAHQLLARGEAVVIFPEGTRVRHGSLGDPRRGAGRLALETGAPVVPIALTGTERARRGWRFRPVKVQVRCGRPLTFPHVDRPSPKLAGAVTDRIWACVQLQWEWLGGLPPIRTAAVVGAGSMGTALAVLLARSGLRVQLACRTLEQAERIAAEGENERYLPGVPLDPGISVCTVPDVEPAAADLVVLAVPCAALPAVVGRLGAQIGPRSAVLVASKGLVPPLGASPSEYVSRRVRARAVVCLGGPAHAHEAVTRGASVVLAARNAHLRRQLEEALERGGLRVEATDDVPGTELAGCAKNAAALASAVALTRGFNLAGAAAGRVFAEVHELALASGARSQTFAGLAGAGDLVATALAEGSRNRRAGELLGRGIPSDRVDELLEQTAESLATVPLLVEALARHGVHAPVTTGLRDLLHGRVSPDEWLASVHPTKPSGAARAA